MVDKVRRNPKKLLELLRLPQQLGTLLVRQRVRRRWGCWEHDFGLYGCDGGHDRQSRMSMVVVVGRRRTKKDLDKILVAGYMVTERENGPSDGAEPSQGGGIYLFPKTKRA